MDYYLSSVNAEPDNAERHYSERLVLLRRFPMYCYRPELPEELPSREKYGLPEDFRLYACTQTLFKFHPDFDEVVGAILRQDVRGLLVLFEGAGAHRYWTNLLRERFASTFPDVADRVVFLKRLPKKDFLSFLRMCDVILDTLHFNGGYTSLLSFASGTPIVTWPGKFMRGRLTLSFYKQMGVMDCVAENAESYVNIALKLANDRNWRGEISEKIKARADDLFEDIEAVRELECFFEHAVEGAQIKG
jgi:predicted O-linked N-acetylglucosamine transferase (SPINDLY family)